MLSFVENYPSVLEKYFVGFLPYGGHLGFLYTHWLSLPTDVSHKMKLPLTKRFPGRCLKIMVKYSTVSVMFISFAFTHERKKRLSSTQRPRKILAHFSQNPGLFHTMYTFILRKKHVSCVRYQQSHACSRFSRSLRKRSVEMIKIHARKG